MSETIPYLTVHRPVQNIGQERMDALRDRLLEETDAAAPMTAVEGLLKPANGLFSAIVAKGEFLRVQRKLGRDRLDAAGVEELEAKLDEAFADCPETWDVPTLPALTYRWGELPKFILGVAYGKEVIKERWLAQNVIADYVGVERPKHWFSRAKKTVPVQLAISRTSEQLILLNRLEVIVGKKQILPLVTNLGKTDIQRDAIYSR